jgi:hypothetical protein
MHIRLNRPYKIVSYMEDKYIDHYAIPSSKCLIVPIKNFGDEALCDVRWQDDSGEMNLRQNTMFSISNLVPLERLRDFDLFEIYKHYYQAQP